MEFAKDVSGLSNGGGGILLLGFSTRKDPTHGEDRIGRERPFPISAFDPDQYRQVLSTWLWPPLDDVELRVFPSRADPSKCVVAIVVPAVAEESRPLLVAKSMLGTRRKVELVFGYCERKRTHVAHYDIRRLHGLLRDGRLLAEEIRGGFSTMQSMLAELPASAPEPTPEPPINVVSRLNDALQVVGHYEGPAFLLAATPRCALNLRALFEARHSPLVGLLEEPPVLRDSGFGIAADINSRIVEGRLRRSVVEHYTLLEIHRDGVVVFIAPGNQGRLCWGRRRQQRSRYIINQLALVEMAYLFCNFAQQVYECAVQAGEIYDLEMRILRLRRGNQNFYLEPGVLGQSSGSDGVEAPEESKTARVSVRYGQETAGRAAFLLLADLYTWMGFEEDRIPYTTKSDGAKAVDPAQIVAAGQ